MAEYGAPPSCRATSNDRSTTRRGALRPHCRRAAGWVRDRLADAAARSRPGEDEERVARAAPGGRAGPFGQHTHWTSPTHARPTGGDPAARVRREAAWLRARGLEPRSSAAAAGTPTTRCGRRSPSSATSTAPRATGAPRRDGDLVELPTTHSLGALARGVLGRSPPVVHAYFHDYDLLDSRAASRSVGARGSSAAAASRCLDSLRQLSRAEDDVVRHQAGVEPDEPAGDERQLDVLAACEQRADVVGRKICRCVGSVSGPPEREADRFLSRNAFGTDATRRPPGRSTRRASATTPPGSRTCSSSSPATTTSKLASSNGRRLLDVAPVRLDPELRRLGERLPVDVHADHVVPVQVPARQRAVAAAEVEHAPPGPAHDRRDSLRPLGAAEDELVAPRRAVVLSVALAQLLEPGHRPSLGQEPSTSLARGNRACRPEPEPRSGAGRDIRRRRCSSRTSSAALLRRRSRRRPRRDRSRRPRGSLYLALVLRELYRGSRRSLGPPLARSGGEVAAVPRDRTVLVFWRRGPVRAPRAALGRRPHRLLARARDASSRSRSASGPGHALRPSVSPDRVRPRDRAHRHCCGRATRSSPPTCWRMAGVRRRAVLVGESERLDRSGARSGAAAAASTTSSSARSRPTGSSQLGSVLLEHEAGRAHRQQHADSRRRSCSSSSTRRTARRQGAHRADDDRAADPARRVRAGPGRAALRAAAARVRRRSTGR